MARTLHLLVCISAAMTASGGYSVQSWSPAYNFDYSTQYESMNVRPDRSSAKMMLYEPVKILNRGRKPVPLYWRRARSAEYTRKSEKPKECENLCDNVQNYPVELADNIIEDLGDKIKYLTKEKLVETSEVKQRVGGLGYQELCASETMIKYPLGGLDSNGTYRVILNNQKNPIQGVRVEICNATDIPCRKFINAMPNYHTFCTQKYTYRPMLVIDGNKELQVDIAVPSWCACVFSHD